MYNKLHILLKKSMNNQIELKRNSDFWKKEIPDRVPPILWFGNVNPNVKVVTIGANPSRTEVLDMNRNDAELYQQMNKEYIYYNDNKRRIFVFNREEDLENYSDTDIKAIYDSFQNYFHKNPYMKWFWRLNRFLEEGVNSSFMNNTAVHIDLMPFITIRNFTDILEYREVDELFNSGYLNNILIELIDTINPDKVILFGRNNIRTFKRYFNYKTKKILSNEVEVVKLEEREIVLVSPYLPDSRHNYSNVIEVLSGKKMDKQSDIFKNNMTKDVTEQYVDVLKEKFKEWLVEHPSCSRLDCKDSSGNRTVWWRGDILVYDPIGKVIRKVKIRVNSDTKRCAIEKYVKVDYKNLWIQKKKKGKGYKIAVNGDGQGLYIYVEKIY